MDPISDFFTRIKNGYRARKDSVIVPYSKMKEEIARLLEARGYIASSEKKGRKVRKFLEINLRYEGKEPALADFKRISKPSQRLYTDARSIRAVRQGSGLLVVSTSKGLMSGDDARKAGIGGEMIAEVW